MKNLIALFCIASAITTLAESNVSTYTESGNTFGVLRVDIGDAKQAIIAVPWLEPSTGDAAIAVTNVIKTANLTSGDWLYYYDTGAQSYKAWQLDANKNWVPAQVVKDDQVAIDAGANQTLTRGNAILLKRSGTGSVYLYGQVASSASGFVTMARSSGEAHTLIAPPRATATDINDGTWANVKDGDQIVIGSLAPFKFDPVGKKWGHKSLALGAGGAIVTNWTDTTGATIPVGQGAWYISNKFPGVTTTWSWNDLPATGN